MTRKEFIATLLAPFVVRTDENIEKKLPVDFKEVGRFPDLRRIDNGNGPIVWVDENNDIIDVEVLILH